MILFSVIALVAILIILTVLITWMWLSISSKDADSVFLGVIATLIYSGACLAIINYIIIWGQPLVK